MHALKIDGNSSSTSSMAHTSAVN